VNISMNTERFNGQKTFPAMQTKAGILTALGREQEAESVMTEALAMNPSVTEIHQYGRSLLTAGKNDRALDVFKLNRKNHPDDKFTTFVGLARGYAAVGNKKEAIKSWETALKNIPEDQKSNTALFEAELKKLKE
jgi:tetratricopeptide (TPR) repeat protein